MPGSRIPKSSGSRLSRSRSSRARSSHTRSYPPPPPPPFFNNPPQNRMDIQFLLNQAPPSQAMQIAEQQRIQAERASQRHKCQICPKSFKTRPRLKYHEEHEHPRMGPPPFTTVPPLLRFPSNSSRNRSVHTCQICRSVFSKKGELKKHNDAVHKKIKPHQCPYPGCFQAFYLPKDLKNHMKCVHEKESRFKCNHCGLGFKKKEHVRRHVRQVHEKIRDFSCPTCPNSKFGTQQNLQAHLNTQKHNKAAARQAKNFWSGGGSGCGGGPGHGGGNGNGWGGGSGGGSSGPFGTGF